MKIIVINGSMRRGSTYHCAQAVIEKINNIERTEVTEFFLPQDMPSFCAGCYNCFYKGEDACPHAKYVQPIVRAIESADLIMLTSPVYGFDVSGQMKALLDHLCYMWMSHRPNPSVFRKVGLAVTTTAGMGRSHTAKTLTTSLKYWGVKNIFSFSLPLAAKSWQEVSEKNKQKIAVRADRLARHVTKAVKNIDKSPNLPRSFIFKIMAAMQKKNNYNPTDRAHWEAQGWLSGKKPF